MIQSNNVVLYNLICFGNVSLPHVYKSKFRRNIKGIYFVPSCIYILLAADNDV